MKIEQVHTLVLGAGPSGLAAGYTLAKAGLNPVVLERDKVCGGLMRSIHRGDFVVDVGRKELYNRLAKVDALWREILGPDYRDYPHRGGILYDGRIIDMMPAYSGFRRGMPWGMFIGCAWDFGRAQVTKRLGSRPRARTLEEFFYQERGRGLTRIFSQGFQEKLTGKKWGEITLPDQGDSRDEPQPSLFQTLRELIVRVFSKKEVNTFKGIWRHPAKGTGQICDSLAAGITKHGGRIEFQANLLGMTAANGRVTEVTAEVGGEQVTYKPLNVVSSIPIEFVLKYLLPDQSAARQTNTRALDPLRRTVVLVYVFLNEVPKFPQAWLQVTCPSTRIGRITNYTAFNGDMVPEGKTCLCCEYYCFGPDALLEMPNEQIVSMTLDDLTRFGLVDRTKIFDQLVLKLPGADASQNRDNFMSEARVKLMKELQQFENLYYVNRTETDIATLAGMEAGEAILAGNRADFDRRADPAQLQIRSEGKAFEFKSPIAV
jgi:protoporphyrinogen oxidase